MNDNNDIPEMKIDKPYSNNPVPETSNQEKKEMEKTKKELDKLKSFIVKKYKYVQAIGILPPQSIKFFIDEEEVPKETEKHVHMIVIIPEDKLKKIPEMKKEIISEIEKLRQKIWLQIKTPFDIWEICMDSKFELSSSISMSYPLYDKGILAGLRVAEIHKSLVLQKFERYVVSYVIAGSMVRGEAVKTSDVDVFVIINDTDVKRMPRLELKEKLRAIIYEYIGKASSLAGVKAEMLNVQVYLLTDFWEAVKDAHPVMFTFIRDGVPLYDRGTFMPWKSLLRMGKLKPSPEAIDMFMSMGDKTVHRVKRTLLEIVMGDIYWSVLTPSQALLMLYGLPPPNVKETVSQMRKVFYEKEKMLEKKYIDILEEIAIKYYKGYEHQKIKEISGKEVDKLLKNTEDYLKRLKELREQIDKKAQEKTIEEIYRDVFELLKNTFKKKSQTAVISEFEKQIKKGKFSPQHLRILNNIIKARTEFKKGKLDLHKVDNARKNASILINDLIEYNQRCELVSLEKGRIKIKYKEKGKEKFAELLNCGGVSFLFKDDKIKKLKGKVQDSDMKEVSEALEKQKSKNPVEISSDVFELLKKELKDFEIVL